MELTTAQIRDFAGSDACYEEATRIVDEQCIVSLDIDDYSNNNLIMINATLQDKKKYYEVNMSIDKDDFVVLAHMCSCHDTQHIACVHCSAVLIKLQREETASAKNVSLKQAELSSDTLAINLMNTYEKQIVYSFLALNLKQAIHLEPVLELRQHNILALTLKVGNEKKYIVKDIRGFLDDIAQNVKRSYGKDLTFLHNINSFDAQSQKLIQFMIIHEYDLLYFEHIETLTHCPQARNMCLTPDALDAFFTMYDGSDVMHRIKEKTLVNLHFQAENPPFTLTIKQRENNHYEIVLNPLDYEIIEGRNHIYIVKEHILYRCNEAFSKACAALLSAFKLKKGAMYVTHDVMPNFYSTIIMNIKDYISIQGDDISSFAPMPLVCRVYIDMPRVNVISARLLYCYGSVEYNAFSSSVLSSARSITDEIATRLVFMKYMKRVDAVEGIAYIENSQDAIYEFLDKGIDELSSTCEIYATDKFKKLQIRDSVHISMGVRIESNLLEINFDTFDFPVEELSAVLQAYRLNKRYYRMKNGSFVNIDDSALQELSSILNGIHVSDKEISSGKVQVVKYRAMYVDTSIKDTNIIQVERDASFKNIIRDIRNIADSDYAIPDSLKPILRNYQKVGYRWLKTMADYGFGGILADDMGIGKTLQIIALLEDELLHHSSSLSLVVCPSSLLLNWESEIAKFSSQLSCILISGSGEQRIAQIARCKEYNIVITSYDYLKRDIALYEGIRFTYEIIDEAQYIKNHSTKNATAVKQIKSLHRFALTGTPIENSLAELWSIFDYLMPGYLYSYHYFKKQFEKPIVMEQDPITLKELQHLVEPFILRRIKKDVLKELPEKVEHTMFIEMEEEARKLYMANLTMIREDLQSSFKEKGFEKSKVVVLSMLTRLRQLCCDPRLIYENYHGVGSKVAACIEYIESCIASNKKVLLFSQFTSLLALLEKELVKRNIAYYLLKGSTPKILRQQYVNAFNTDKTPLFLISLKAGGTGLNLTSAEVVIHFDPWWNISAQNQATDRAYRIGQHNNVQVVKMIAKDTIEEKIMHLQALKQDLSDSIMQVNDGIITQMSKDDIMDLFQ